MSIIEKAIEKMGKKDVAQDADKKVSGEKVGDSIDDTPESQVPLEEQSEERVFIEEPASKNSIELDFNILRQHGMVVPDNTRSKIADEYRLIKRPLLMNAAGKGASIVENANLIMVTSSVPSEGKTFSSINLAMSIALERDKHVLLVDADVSRPSVSRVLNLGQKPGLIDMLVDKKSTFSDLVLKTNIPNLSILTSGRAHPHSTELLASDEMKSLTNELSKRYADRIVIFDSPPILATTEAAVLANHMGQIVMVVEAGHTQQKLVKEALSRLNEPEILGFILNKTIGGVMGGEYDYSYGYYGGGYAAEK